MLSPIAAQSIRDSLESWRREVGRVESALEKHREKIVHLDTRRTTALERVAELQADLARLVPSPATIAAKVAR